MMCLFGIIHMLRKLGHWYVLFQSFVDVPKSQEPAAACNNSTAQMKSQLSFHRSVVTVSPSTRNQGANYCGDRYQVSHTIIG